MSWRKAARARTGKYGSGTGMVLRDGDAESGDALAVAFGFGVLQVQGAAQGFQSVVVGLFELRERAGELRGAFFDQLLEIALIIAVFDEGGGAAARGPRRETAGLFRKA